ncbi:hypothetical protein V6C27_13780 [Peptococcaceae bacterium 1198_IL3148]
MKKITLLILVLMLMVCMPVFAAEEIGMPFKDLYGKAEYEAKIFELFTITPLVTETANESKDAVTGIVITDPSWQPNWEQIPFTRYWVDCSAKLVSKYGIPNLGDATFVFFNMFTNLIFTISTGLVRISTEVLIAAFHTNFWIAFGGQLSDTAREIWNGNSNSAGLKNTLFMLVVTFAGIYYIYKLIKFRYTDIFKGALISILVTALLFVYIAKTDTVLNYVSDVADTVAGAAFTTLSYNNEVPAKSVLDRGILSFAENSWNMLVIQPWCYMNFGTTDLSTLYITGEEYEKVKEVLPQEIKEKVTQGMRVDQIILGLQAGSQERADAISVFQDDKIDHGKHTQTVSSLAPSDVIVDFLFACVLFITAAIYSIFIIVIGSIVFIAGLGILLSVVVAPFVLLLAMLPEVGWNYANKLGVMTLNAFGVKIVYGIFMGVICVVLNIVMSL